MEPITFAIQPLQAALQDLLRKHAWFADIPILTEEKGDIENELHRALGDLEGIDGKIGVCIVILTPSASVKSQTAPGPILDPLEVILSVVENVTINAGALGTQKKALQIVEILLRYLHHKQFGNAVLVAKAPAYTIVASEPLTYHVFFQTKLALKPIP